MSEDEWMLYPDDRKIEYVGPWTSKNLCKAVWEPAHRLTSHLCGLAYVDDKMDCIGFLNADYGELYDEEGFEISRWEIKTRHKRGYYLLRHEQHHNLYWEDDGYVFCTLEQESPNVWRVVSIEFELARVVEKGLGRWSPGPEERDYWVQYYS